MSLVIQEKTVPVGPQQVWRLIADPAKLPAWLPNVTAVELIGRQDSGIGRQQRVSIQASQGEWVQEQAIIAWEPGRRLGWRVLSNQIDGQETPWIKDLQTIVILSKKDEATAVRFETSWIPAGFGGGLYSVLVYRPLVRRQTRQALNTLAGLLASRGSSVAADGRT